MIRSFFYPLIASAFILLISISGYSQEETLQPYFRIASTSESIENTQENLQQALQKWDFSVIGSYNPEGNKDLLVIAYTREDLQDICVKATDRGILASVLKLGLRKNGSEIEVSMLNPMYLFYAYLRDDAQSFMDDLTLITGDARQAMSEVGTEFSGFGGNESIEDLKKYHYMAFMPYFDDPVELKTFGSFQEGLNTIRKNLKAKKGNTLPVFEITLEDKQMAIFGVGIMDEEDGEAKFLPIIGEENIAAMPYEIVLVGKEATILHGKFRFALHWPELTMGQFMKISSTPGDVEDILEALTEE